MLSVAWSQLWNFIVIFVCFECFWSAFLIRLRMLIHVGIDTQNSFSEPIFISITVFDICTFESNCVVKKKNFFFCNCNYLAVFCFIRVLLISIFGILKNFCMTTDPHWKKENPRNNPSDPPTATKIEEKSNIRYSSKRCSLLLW